MPPTSSIPSKQFLSLPNFTGTSPSRLQSLYSDISRQKHSNPTSYQSNVSWWRATLEAIVAKGWQPNSSDKLVLHVDQSLPDYLRYEGTGKPLCLGTVIAELSSSHLAIPLSQFLSTTQSVYDKGWLPLRIASYVIGKPFWWALQQVNIVSTDEGGHESDAERWRKVKDDYIVLALVERAAESVLERQRRIAGSLADTLFNFDSFRVEFAGNALEGVTLSDVDIKVLVKFLERDKSAVVVDKEVIKFIDASTAEPLEITAVDRGILELKTVVANLDKQIERIQRKMDECTEKATVALRQKRKELALSYIRSRKLSEDLLRQRLGSIETLQSTLIRVEAAAGDIQIMKSYESSTTTLRTLLAHPSLQRDTIDQTLDALAAANADAKDVDDTIRMGGDMAMAEAGIEIDDAELEAELAKLVEGGEKEQLEKADMDRLARQHMQKDDVPKQESVVRKDSHRAVPVLEIA